MSVTWLVICPAVWVISLRRPVAVSATLSMIRSSVWVMWLSAMTTSSLTPCTVLSRPFSPTISSVSRTQFGSPVSSSTPTMPFATMATWSFVSSNQARSSSSSSACARPPRPPPLFRSRMIRATSCRLLASVTVTSSSSRILSRHAIRVIRSVITVPYSGSGIRHIVPTVSRSSGTPVAWESSSPVTVTVTTGSQWLFSRSCAAFSSRPLSLMLLSVKIRSFRP